MEKLITFKMGEELIAEIDRHYKRLGFSTRAEFMRTAIRNELEMRVNQERSKRHVKEINLRAEQEEHKGDLKEIEPRKEPPIKDDEGDFGILKREIWG